MFGIGLPEMIVILALALIVVGPDKLPELARSLAKGILELKKTANTIKDNLTEDGNPLDDIKPELEDAAKSIKEKLIDEAAEGWHDVQPGEGVNPSPSEEPVADTEIIEADLSEIPEQDLPPDAADKATTSSQEPEKST